MEHNPNPQMGGQPPMGQPPMGQPPMGQPPMGYGAPPPARPTRFTVIAVLNFVFAGISLLALLGLFALLAAAAKLQKLGGFYKGPGTGLIWMLILVTIASIGLMIVSGVGLLKSTKWGWMTAMIYAGVSVLFTLIFAVGGGGFGLTTVTGLAYPGVVIGLLAAPVARKAVGM